MPSHAAAPRALRPGTEGTGDMKGTACPPEDKAQPGAPSPVARASVMDCPLSPDVLTCTLCRQTLPEKPRLTCPSPSPAASHGNILDRAHNSALDSLHLMAPFIPAAQPWVTGKLSFQCACPFDKGTSSGSSKASTQILVVPTHGTSSMGRELPEAFRVPRTPCLARQHLTLGRTQSPPLCPQSSLHSCN